EGREEITDPLVCTLRHLTAKSDFSDRARRDIIENNGIQGIMKLLNYPCSWAVVKALVGLILNLARSADNVAPMREFKVVHQLIKLLVEDIQGVNIIKGFKFL